MFKDWAVKHKANSPVKFHGGANTGLKSQKGRASFFFSKELLCHPSEALSHVHIFPFMGNTDI